MSPSASADHTAVPASAETFLRIEKGSPDATELAALTSVLLARAAVLANAGEETEQTPRRTAGWRRLERRSRAGTPRSWRDDTRR
ncbi:acyl-CoA carboxylase subunit epsilon [Streptomyces griseosporeus]|uniref:acyl-CoA carboxylase subunit epsilon n=1 Tax=Streptomyces griseosporeus TaxID=1910 RepID=UPI0037B6DDAB